MMGHNIGFKGIIWKIIPKLSCLPLLILSTDLMQGTKIYLHIICSAVLPEVCHMIFYAIQNITSGFL